MISWDKLISRLDTIQHYYRILDAKLGLPIEEFLSSSDHYLVTERALHLISEAMIDIGNHIVAKRQLGKPQTYAEIFRILSGEKMITESLGEKLAAFSGLRNILVHDYTGLDRRRLYLEANDNKEDIIAFVDQIRKVIVGFKEMQERNK